MSDNEKNKRPTVILRRCDAEDPALIRPILHECFEQLGFKPSGNVLVKPNVVTANKGYIHHSYTHPSVMESLLEEIKTSVPAKQITVGESSGFGIPPGLFLSEAGYYDLAAKTGVRVIDFNEDHAEWTTLSKSKIHKGFHVAESISKADTKIWAPKLKYHICCQITNSLKLNVGILQHRDRMKYHDDRLNEKIVDLLEIGYPDIVVADAIIIGHGYESAPQGMKLGLIMVADNPLAADAVAAKILGYEPENVVHLRLASERGYGSISLSDFNITGDITIDELRKRTIGVESEYQDIHKVDTPIKFYCGNSPERDEFCYGGCLAAIKGCMGTVDKRKPGSVRGAAAGAVVTGVYKGDVIHPGETVLLIGDCTRVEGKLEAKKVKRLKGCPIGTSRLLLGFPLAFGMPSPMLDFRGAVLFIRFGLRHLFRKLFPFVGR